MDAIENILENKKVIENSINKYGHAAEHNFWHFLSLENRNEKCCFFNFKDKGSIMAQIYKDNSCGMISDVLAQKDKKLEIFEEFLEHMLKNKKAKKVFVLVKSDFKNKIKEMSKNSKYLLSRHTIFYTPVFNLKNIDENLAGKQWKKLRNIKNKFYNENNVQIVPSREIKKNKLKIIVDEWRKNRNAYGGMYSYGKIYHLKYINFIENNFEGADCARTLVINGIPSTITAGWRIPNSNNYYSAIGLYNYKFDHMAEAANLDELLHIKTKGYEFADFGNSSKSLLDFKKKFNPEKIYKEYYFSIRL